MSSDSILRHGCGCRHALQAASSGRFRLGSTSPLRGAVHSSLFRSTRSICTPQPVILGTTLCPNDRPDAGDSSDTTASQGRRSARSSMQASRGDQFGPERSSTALCWGRASQSPRRRLVRWCSRRLDAGVPGGGERAPRADIACVPINRVLRFARSVARPSTGVEPAGRTGGSNELAGRAAGR